MSVLTAMKVSQEGMRLCHAELLASNLSSLTDFDCLLACECKLVSTWHYEDFVGPWHTLWFLGTWLLGIVPSLAIIAVAYFVKRAIK